MPGYSGQTVRTKANINRAILEQTRGEFAQLLTYKAEGAGMSVVRIDPAYTSLTCSRCGVAQFDVSLQERNRVHFRCPDCGSVLNRSINAAKNILARGLAEPASSAGVLDIVGRTSTVPVAETVLDKGILELVRMATRRIF